MLESRPTCFGVGGHDIGLLYDGVHHFTVVDWGSAGPLWPMYDLASAIGLIGAMGPELTTAGLDNVNLDLIYGVPFQDLISWEATVLDGKGNIDFSRLR